MVPRRTDSRPIAGFSLIEMSVVLVLAGVLLTLGMGALSLQQDYSALSATQRRIEIVKDSLVTFLRVNRRLPCPVQPLATLQNIVGKEVAGSCPTAGVLPWIDLGLPKETAMDGYNNFFTYFVTTPGWTTQATSLSAFGFMDGLFDIREDGEPSTIKSVVVLVSHGKNGIGAITRKGSQTARTATDGTDTCEDANSTPVATTLYSGKSSVCTNNDDIVMPLRPNDLMTPLIKDGAMKSAQAVLEDKLLKLKSTLLAYATCTPTDHFPTGACKGFTVSGRVFPPPEIVSRTPFTAHLPLGNLTRFGLVIGDTNDPWGMLFQYMISDENGAPKELNQLTNLIAGLKNSTPQNENILIKSSGPDKLAGTADDISYSMSLPELRAGIGTEKLLQ